MSQQEHGSPLEQTPPDRSRVGTEKPNPRSRSLHTMSAAQLVRLIHDEDRRVAEAVGGAGESLARFIEAVEPRFAAGGRLVYLGAGTSGRLGVLDASEMGPTFQLEPGRIIGIIAGGDASLRRSSEGAEDDARGAVADLDRLALTDRDAVLGIAAGGTTPYVLGGLAHVRTLSTRPLTGLLTCCEPTLRARPGHRLHAHPGVYNELIRMHREGWPLLQERHHLQPRRVLPHAAAGAAELQPLHARAPVRPRRHPPRTSTSPTAPRRARCRLLPGYEQASATPAGIDLQLLGIGRTGHIGFNEPGSPRTAAPA
jgi:hypothetical protein